MENLRVFSDTEFGQLGILIIDGKEYFPATDCAKMLGYANPYDAISRHCRKDGVVKREVGVETGIKVDGSPSIQNVDKNFITEGNLYRLITNSNLPSAEKFESWVFDDVIPTLRKTGSYNMSTATARNDIGEIASLMREWRLWASKEKMPYDKAMASLVRFMHTIGVPFPEDMAYRPTMDVNTMQLALDFIYKQGKLK